MNMFDEIDNLKKDLPNFKTITNGVSKQKLNNYQIVSLVILGLGIFIGIIFGNVFPSCGTTSGLYSKCTTTEFNFSLTIAIWFVSFLICVVFFWMGKVVELLKSIDKKLGKSK